MGARPSTPRGRAGGVSAFVHTPCACGVEIIAISSDEDDLRIAVASHNDLPRHREWRAVQALKRPTRGPCICKGRGVTNSGESVSNPPHTPPTGEAQDRRPRSVGCPVVS
jgi:hypothetical protein